MNDYLTKEGFVDLNIVCSEYFNYLENNLIYDFLKICSLFLIWWVLDFYKGNSRVLNKSREISLFIVIYAPFIIILKNLGYYIQINQIISMSQINILTDTIIILIIIIKTYQKKEILKKWIKKKLKK